MKRNQLTVIIGVLAAVIIVLVAAIVWNQGWRQWRRPLAARLQAGETISLLVLGTGNADELERVFIVLYEPQAPTLLIFQAPGLTRLDLPGSPVVLKSLYREAGASGVRTRLGEFLKLNLNGVLVMPAESFFRLIDLLKGIEVRLEKPVEGTVRGEKVIIPVDRYRFNSDKIRALAAYIEFVESPVERAELQRRLLQGLVRQLKADQAFLLQPEVWNQFEDYYHTDLAPDDLRAVFTALMKFNEEQLDLTRLPGETEVRDGMAYFVARAPELATILPASGQPGRSPTAAPPLQPLRITIALQNGVGLPGIGNRVRERLQPFPDLDIVEVGNADNFRYTQTQIVSRTENIEPAVRVKEHLGIGVVSSAPSSKSLVDVTIIIGKDLAEREGML